MKVVLNKRNKSKGLNELAEIKVNSSGYQIVDNISEYNVSMINANIKLDGMPILNIEDNGCLIYLHYEGPDEDRFSNINLRGRWYSVREFLEYINLSILSALNQLDPSLVANNEIIFSCNYDNDKLSITWKKWLPGSMYRLNMYFNANSSALFNTIPMFVTNDLADYMDNDTLIYGLNAFEDMESGTEATTTQVDYDSSSLYNVSSILVTTNLPIEQSLIQASDETASDNMMLQNVISQFTLSNQNKLANTSVQYTPTFERVYSLSEIRQPLRNFTVSFYLCYANGIVEQLTLLPRGSISCVLDFSPKNVGIEKLINILEKK